MTHDRPIRWEFLGTVPYAEALALQETARAAVLRREAPERLFLLEHPHVYTLGRNASGTDVVAPAPWLAERGVEVADTDRGGQRRPTTGRDSWWAIRSPTSPPTAGTSAATCATWRRSW